MDSVKEDVTIESLLRKSMGLDTKTEDSGEFQNDRQQVIHFYDIHVWSQTVLRGGGGVHVKFIWPKDFAEQAHSTLQQSSWCKQYPVILSCGKIACCP